MPPHRLHSGRPASWLESAGRPTRTCDVQNLLGSYVLYKDFSKHLSHPETLHDDVGLDVLSITLRGLPTRHWPPNLKDQETERATISQAGETDNFRSTPLSGYFGLAACLHCHISMLRRLSQDQCFFTSTRSLVRTIWTGSPGWPPRLSHSSSVS